MRLSALLAGCSLALLLTAATATAKTTLKYPAAKAAVVLDVPDEWTAEEMKGDDNHRLTFAPTDTNLAARIILMSLGKLDPKDYKSLVVKMGKASVANSKMSGVTYTGPVENKAGSGVPLTTEIAKGKVGEVNITLMICLFTLKGSTYAIIVTSESSILTATADVADEIINSIQMLN